MITLKASDGVELHVAGTALLPCLIIRNRVTVGDGIVFKKKHTHTFRGSRHTREGIGLNTSSIVFTDISLRSVHLCVTLCIPSAYSESCRSSHKCTTWLIKCEWEYEKMLHGKIGKWGYGDMGKSYRRHWDCIVALWDCLQGSLGAFATSFWYRGMHIKSWHSDGTMFTWIPEASMAITQIDRQIQMFHKIEGSHSLRV